MTREVRRYEDLCAKIICINKINIFMHNTFHSTPTWTIKGRYETVTSSNKSTNFPGPSDYNYDKVKTKAPTYCIGTSKRSSLDINQMNPGPGTYELKSSIMDGPKKSFSKKLQFSVKKSPGPQDYNPEEAKIQKSEPKFSIRVKAKSFVDLQREKNQYQPAPGSYEVKGSFNNPKGVIGTSKRKELCETEETPGPGNYLTIDKLEKSKLLNSKTTPRYSMGIGHRKTTSSSSLTNVPGPGAYTLGSFIDMSKNKNKGFTMRPHTMDLEEMERRKVPGPGHYDIKISNKHKSPEYKCGSEKRFGFLHESYRSNTPAPGTHPVNPDYRFRTSQTTKFGLSQRKSLYENEKTPGPGNYQEKSINFLVKTPKFSPSKTPISLKSFLNSSTQAPPPGKYDPNYKLIHHTAHSAFTPSEKRPDFEKHRLTPGPGHYVDPQTKSGPTWKIGTEERLTFTRSTSLENPSAAYYNIANMIPNPPRYMLSREKQLQPSKHN